MEFVSYSYDTYSWSMKGYGNIDEILQLNELKSLHFEEKRAEIKSCVDTLTISALNGSRKATVHQLIY